MAEEEQGFVTIPPKIVSFRQKTAQRLLYSCIPSWCDTAQLLQLSFDKQLFLLTTRGRGLCWTNTLLQLCIAGKFLRSLMKQMELWACDVQASLRVAGCTKLGHLIKMTATSCTKTDTLAHLLKRWFQGLWGGLFFWFVCFWFFFCSAKLAIWFTHRNRAQSASSVEPVPVPEWLLKTRFRVQHRYYQMMDNIQALITHWHFGRVILSITLFFSVDVAVMWFLLAVAS